MFQSAEKITLSIVSHGQAALVRELLNDLAALSQRNFEVIITVNLPEDESLYQGFVFPLHIIRNASPKGFGENHNAAFEYASTAWFAVVNPDIRIQSLDFVVLLDPFKSKSVAAVAPVVLSAEGAVEDSARRFPTFFRFARRVVFRQRKSDYDIQSAPYQVDWVAGMFIAFRREAFQQVGGFDSRRFYMYLEDADICRRMGKNNWHVVSAMRFLTGL